MHTYASSLKLIGAVVPNHLSAAAEVPVLTGVQAQGDLIIIPTQERSHLDWQPVPDGGIQVMRGEATGNTHWLHRGFCSPGVQYSRVERELLIGFVKVPEGESALLLHTDEHGSNGIGAGVYAVHGKRELAKKIRRVAD